MSARSRLPSVVMGLSRTALLATASLLAVCWSNPAWSQVTKVPATPQDAPVGPATAPTQETPAPETQERDQDGIGDVIVTAQRRSESLQNVPIAVTAVTSEILRSRGIQTTQELGAAVPSLTIAATSGFIQPRIRGIGNNAFGAGYESGVATYIDGVYIASAPASLFTLNNIERVEVLKGPQGTLFGRNATGGLIQIVTRAPSETKGGEVSLSADNYGTLVTDAYATGGIFDGLSADFAARVSAQKEGYGRNIATGRDVNRIDEDINLRTSLLFDRSTGTRIRVSADYERTLGSTFSATRLAPGTGAPFPFLPLPRNKWSVNQDIQPFNLLRSGGISGNLDQDIGFAHLISITAYRESRYRVRFDGDVTSTPAIGIDVATRDRQFSEELQLTSAESSKVKWVVGAYYFKGASFYDPSRANLFGPVRPQTPGGPITSVATFSRLDTESIAGYAQATIPFGERTNLTVGARYTTEKREIEASTVATLNERLDIPGAPIPDQARRFSRPTWRAALDHRFSPEILVYASYNRGFKSGGFNGQFPTDPAFSPEKLDAYEVGVKSDLLDRRLRVNASAFYYDYSNLQVSRFVNSQVSYYNGAAARVYGLDVDFEARPVRRLTLSGGLTLLHDRFTDFPNAVISTQVPTGIVITTGSAKDNRLPFTPDFTGTLTAQYTAPIGTAELGLDASVTYNDGFFSQPDNILRQPSYFYVSAGVRVTLADGLTLRAWGRNLANEAIVTTLAAGTFNSNVSYQPPRTYGLTIGARF